MQTMSAAVPLWLGAMTVAWPVEMEGVESVICQREPYITPVSVRAALGVTQRGSIMSGQGFLA
jgi:hypothetical protein